MYYIRTQPLRSRNRLDFVIVDGACFGVYIYLVHVYLRTYVTTFSAATASTSSATVPVSSVAPLTEKNT